MLQFIAGHPGLLLCLGIGAVQLLQFCPVYPAHAGIPSQGLALHPPFGFGGPFACSAVVGHGGTTGDSVAVDVAGGVGVELPGDCRRGDLVHERHALPPLPLEDQSVSLEAASKRSD